MKQIIILLVLCIYSWSAYSQDRVDLLYLKSGETLRGKLESFVRDKSLVFILNSGDTVRSEGTSLDLVKGMRIGKKNKGSYQQKETGFWNLYELGANFESEGGSTFYPQGGIHGTWGYQWSKMLKVGLGTGIEAMEDFNVMPIFLSYQGDWRKGKVTPYHFFNLGYGMASARSYNGDRYSEVKGGFRLNSGLGIKIHQRKTFITISAGYLLQNVEYQENFWGGWWTDTAGINEVSRSFRRMSFRVGIGF